MHAWVMETKGFDKPRVSPAQTSEATLAEGWRRGVSSVQSTAAARTVTRVAMYVVKIVYCQVTMEFVDRDLGTARYITIDWSIHPEKAV